ncbi:MAG: glutamine-hydrolyzing GMP synthase subunit GuaA [Candidatus Altiarchaeota archaeon]|nr:glutamine-hydrolyzing GMP synthase subunit GuaA [Candidatus Altiarchaeota archaeon]
MENFKPKEFIQEKMAEIRSAVGQKRSIVALSGGVDSSVVAVLAHKAVGNNLRVVFLDDGLMREGEPEGVKEDFARLGMTVEVLDVADEFFKALKGKTDPEDKRKAFRNIFYTVLGRAVKESSAKFMFQGTIAADVKETAGGVKTQHNVLEQIGVNPQQWGLEKVMEPLIDLYKPEVRIVAKELGLPKECYERMPFPGPGLSARVIGEVTPERVAIVKKAHVIVEEETKQFGAFQSFAVLLNDKATGLSGDKRAFGNIIVVRSVDSKDALTATPTKIPWDVLIKIQRRIVTQIPSVVKVLYDITGKPPSTIEYI